MGVFIFVSALDPEDLNTIHILAFTHRNFSVNEVGQLHIEEANQKERLHALKQAMALDEILFLSTCNRVEFIFVTDHQVHLAFLERFFEMLYPEFDAAQIQHLSNSAFHFSGEEAIEHLLCVASSVDSMVVGEREIITQVRNAFEQCKAMGLTGDTIRIMIRHTIETAKRVYTETSIARKPVSVVSLAYHKLRDLNVPLDSRILIIGAGVTNTNMSRFLRKHGFTNFHVFNRTFEKAERLAADLNGIAHPLSDLKTYSGGFDVIITCTGSEHHILSPEIYDHLLQGDTGRKVVIDIAIPQDLSPEIVAKHKVIHISVEVLQKISNENLKERSKEIQHVEEIIAEARVEFRQIHHARSVEIAMRDVPNKVKEIRATAVNEVFRNELEALDPNSRETLEKVIGYMEKKYMSMPMLMAKEILLKKHL